MGQAKLRQEKLRAEFLRIVEGWSRPATDEEAFIVAEIEKLPLVTVTVYPPDQLEYMRMKPRECHANCRFMEQNGQEHKIRQVIGWRNDDGIYVLHSVIRQNDGRLYCVTPSEANLQKFEFIPDEEIQCREGDDGLYHYSRKGIEVGYGVRSNPDKTIAYAKKVKERLLSGMNPFEAMKLLK